MGLRTRSLSSRPPYLLPITMAPARSCTNCSYIYRAHIYMFTAHAQSRTHRAACSIFLNRYCKVEMKKYLKSRLTRAFPFKMNRPRDGSGYAPLEAPGGRAELHDIKRQNYLTFQTKSIRREKININTQNTFLYDKPA